MDRQVGFLDQNMLRELDLGSKAKEKDHEVAVNTKRHIQGLPLGGRRLHPVVNLLFICSYVLSIFSRQDYRGDS